MYQLPIQYSSLKGVENYPISQSTCISLTKVTFALSNFDISKAGELFRRGSIDSKQSIIKTTYDVIVRQRVISNV